MAPSALAQVLRQLPGSEDENLLVGPETTDDAAVYRLTDECALVTSLDFFPPIVDDPFTFGAVAAANALSDIYAMGGEPRFAENIVCFPRELDTSVLTDIINGSISKLKEAGASLVGGHTIEDSEVKYGLAVTGFIDPRKVVTNAGAKAGDALILTKPLGVGVITSTLKAGRIDDTAAEEAIASMTTLNRGASEAMVELGANACTDVTGFGLLGHAFEMAKASGVSFKLRSGDVPVFPGVLELVRNKKNLPKSIVTTMDFVKESLVLGDKVDEERKLVMLDPQTSGGLLISIAKDKAELLIEKLGEKGAAGAQIGEVARKDEDWSIRVE